MTPQSEILPYDESHCRQALCDLDRRCEDVLPQDEAVHDDLAGVGRLREELGVVGGGLGGAPSEGVGRNETFELAGRSEKCMLVCREAVPK